MGQKLKSTKVKKVNPYARKILLPCRVNSEEMRSVLAKATLYTDGNVSEFVRYAAINFQPAKKDFAK